MQAFRAIVDDNRRRSLSVPRSSLVAVCRRSDRARFSVHKLAHVRVASSGQKAEAAAAKNPSYLRSRAGSRSCAQHFASVLDFRDARRFAFYNPIFALENARRSRGDKSKRSIANRSDVWL